jgi:hypothetical protein
MLSISSAAPDRRLCPAAAGGLQHGSCTQTLQFCAAFWPNGALYGGGLAGRVRALAPGGVDAALDVAGSGVLPELIELAGGPERVVTIADFGGAQEHGVTFSSGDAGRAVHDVRRDADGGAHRPIRPA